MIRLRWGIRVWGHTERHQGCTHTKERPSEDTVKDAVRRTEASEETKLAGTLILNLEPSELRKKSFKPSPGISLHSLSRSIHCSKLLPTERCPQASLPLASHGLFFDWCLWKSVSKVNRPAQSQCVMSRFRKVGMDAHGEFAALPPAVWRGLWCHHTCGCDGGAGSRGGRIPAAGLRRFLGTENEKRITWTSSSSLKKLDWKARSQLEILVYSCRSSDGERRKLPFPTPVHVHIIAQASDCSRKQLPFCGGCPDAPLPQGALLPLLVLHCFPAFPT